MGWGGECVLASVPIFNENEEVQALAGNFKSQYTAISAVPLCTCFNKMSKAQAPSQPIVDQLLWPARLVLRVDGDCCGVGCTFIGDGIRGVGLGFLPYVLYVCVVFCAGDWGDIAVVLGALAFTY